MDIENLDSMVDSIGSGLGLDLPEPTDAPNDPPEPSDEPAPTEEPSPTEAPAPSGEPTPTETPAPTPPAAVKAPDTWKPEVAAKFASLPPDVQAEIARRESDFYKGIETYKADAGIGKAFATFMSPYNDFVRETQTDVGALFSSFMDTHMALSRGTPEQKLAVLTQAAKSYGLDLGAVSQPADESPFIDPEVKALRERLAALESQQATSVQAQERQRQQEQAAIRAAKEQEIEAFASDPKNSDFDLLAPQIAALIKSGEAKGLRDAYDKAVWLNPVTREKALASEAAARAEATRKAQAEAAAKAKAAAAANVRTSAKSASGATATTSMDDTLSEAYRTITSRS